MSPLYGHLYVVASLLYLDKVMSMIFSLLDTMSHITLALQYVTNNRTEVNLRVRNTNAKDELVYLLSYFTLFLR